MPVPVIGIAIAAKALAAGYGGHVLTAATGVKSRADLLEHAERVVKTMLEHGAHEADAKIVSLREDLAVLRRGHESGWTETYELAAFFRVSTAVGWAHTKSTAAGMKEAGMNIGRHVVAKIPNPFDRNDTNTRH